MWDPFIALLNYLCIIHLSSISGVLSQPPGGDYFPYMVDVTDPFS